MTRSASCPNCGAPFSPDASPEGLCPVCLLSNALQDDPQQDAFDADSTSFEPGMILGAYRIMSLLGKGGMASVYEALDTRLERKVALKVLPPEFLHQASFARRFEQEAKVIASLEHPHIVPIYESGTDHGVPWMAMRLLAGGNMGSLLKHSLPDPVRTVAILSRIAEALDYAHARGVVHRDIKPTNILFDRDGRPSVADFGVARLLERQSVVTHSAAMVGTPHYMAPEQALGKSIDASCDVYSLGIVAYEMFVGSVPFTGDSPVAVLMKHVNEPLPTPPASQLSRTMLSLIRKAVAKDPLDRWPTAGAFVQALEEGVRSVAMAPAGVSPAVNVGKDRRVWRWRMSAAAAFLMALAAVWMLLRQPVSHGLSESLRNGSRSGESEPSEGGIKILPTAPVTRKGPESPVAETVARSGGALAGSGKVRPPAGRVITREVSTPEASTSGTAPGREPPPVNSPTVDSQRDVNVETPAQGRGTVEAAPAAIDAAAPETREALDARGTKDEITQPVRVRAVAPMYPALARTAGIQGDVLLSAVVGPDGEVKEVEIVRSVHRLLDEAARAAVFQYQYKPGLRNGVPDTFKRLITVSFRLD